jgi:hypothetical protein
VITAVVPVSVIKSHPSTGILEQTLDSIRHHLPDSEIILTFDGVRDEQFKYRLLYEEHIRRVLWLADKHYGNVCPYIFDEHQHQTGMLRHVLDDIRTPLMLYVEQDTPLVTDEPIEWDRVTDMFEFGYSNLVRLHHEAVIPEDHAHMMHGMESEFDCEWCGGTDFIRTSQWSQRPHVASVAYYRRILGSHFSPNARCFIEDKMHGVVDEAFNLDGMLGWNQHRLHIYAPKGNMKRSYHTDGRAGAPKYDDSQVW